MLGMQAWATLLAGLLLLLAYRWSRRAGIQRNGVALPKPPNTLLLLGNGILFLQPRQKLFSWFVKCSQIFGYETFAISVPSLAPGVVINDPQNLDFVFKHEAIFGKGEFFKSRSRDLFGNGIINADGDLWKVQRKAGLSFLSKENLRVLTDVALPKFLERSVEQLKAKSTSGESLDLQLLFLEISSQLMGKMAYGMEMHADDDFTTAFDYASGATAERFQNPLWRITELFTGSHFRRSVSLVKAFGKKIVQSAVGAPPQHETDDDRLDEVSGSLIQSLLKNLGDETLAADAALNYLSAGRDTVAQALTWTMMLLMHNRFATDKVRKEADDMMATFQGSRPDRTAFSPSALPYTMAVFYESLRLYPPIPFEIKQVEQPTTLPDGTFLPPKSILVWCTWAMNRSRITWGADAEKFRPERWIENGKLVMKSAAEFPVFNGGARTCLGKTMAELMAAQVIASMLVMFEFMPAYGKPRVSKSSLTLPMEGGLPCYVRLRSSEQGSR